MATGVTPPCCGHGAAVRIPVEALGRNPLMTHSVSGTKSIWANSVHANTCRQVDIYLGFSHPAGRGDNRNMFNSLSQAERFITGQRWFASLDTDLQSQVRHGVYEHEGAKGEVMLAAGAPVQGWYAVLSGLALLRSPTDPRQRASAFIGIPDGEWFGEGSAIKGEPRRYDVIALRPTVMLCLPLTLFNTLLDTSLAFNQFLVRHMNLRLGQAMGIIEAGRVRSPEHRVALYLSRMFWRSTRRLNLTQEELGQLVGLSRQTVNRVLRALEGLGIVSLDFGRVAIMDDGALDAYLTATAGD
jgi:CRP/FNR family cyclic AMP-dependent transcriptional regulator